MKKNKNRILLLVSFCFLFGISLTAVYLLTREYFKLYPSEPVVLGKFPALPEWVFHADGDIISSPAMKDQFVFVKTSNTLYALDLMEKKVEWKVDSVTKQSLVHAPVVANSLVIVVEDESVLAAYSAEAGNLIWKTLPIETFETSTDRIRSISFNSKYLFVARYGLYITAYDLETGRVVWEHDLPGRSNIDMVANEAYVFYTAGQDVASILDANTGFDVWNYSMTGYFGPILLSRNTLFISDERNASLISVDLDSYQINWVKTLPIETYGFNCLIEVDENVLVAAAELVMVSKQNGAIVWSTDELGDLECPVLLNDKIYIRNSQTQLYILEKKAGKELGQLIVQTNTMMKQDFSRSLIAANGLLAVPFGDDRLIVYRP